MALAVLMASPALGDAPKKKKPAVQKKKYTAHQKPTPEQIRRFNELQKKR